MRRLTPKALLFGIAFTGLVASGCSAEDEDGPVSGPTPGTETGGPEGNAPTDWPGGSLGGFTDDGELETRVTGEGKAADGMYSGSAGEADFAAEGGGAEESAGAPSGDAAAPGPAPLPPDGEPQPPMDPSQGGLEGGEIDDNADFEGFLNYLDGAIQSLAGDPSIHPVDVAERHIITVRDAAGDTVPDATVRLFVDGTQITWGRTRADGRFAFFPGAYGSAANKFLVQAEYGNLRGAGSVQAADEGVEIELDADVQPGAPSLDVAFVVDTTGSMGEEIDRIKVTIQSIADRISADETQPDLRFGLVAYKDVGDAYVTRTVNFTDDLQAFQGAVDAMEASGGGDFPEALNEALHETMRGLEWRSQDALRLTFVVADAPAHHYEQAAYTYDDAMLDAATMGVKIFPVASGGSDPAAELQFRQLAQFTLGHFVFITEGQGSPVGSGGSDFNVDPQQFRVEALDDLIVRLVSEELQAFAGN